MCGIFGLWRLDGTRDAIASDMEAMHRVLSHRGPDASDLWQRDGLALGHRRLSILDLSPTGAQPMTSASGRYVIVFNGEVYNFAAIRHQVEAVRSYPWRGGSDTEVMLAAFETWGVHDAVTRFVGMFAFAVWDATLRELHLVRDRFGVKPLHFARTSNGFAFSSELKALALLSDVDRAIDHDALATFFHHSNIAAPRTIYRGVRKQEPATILTFSDPSSAPREHTYWSAIGTAQKGLATPFEGSEEDAVRAVDAQLFDAVRLRLVSDVPLGAFLSGGIDSSVVVAMMQRAASQPARTFSIGFTEADYDESAHAAQMAKHLGTVHTELRVSPREAQNVVPLLAEMFDEPFADSSQIPTYLVAKLARPHVTVALSGDGGDELFGGYNRHVWIPQVWARMHNVPMHARGALRHGMQALRPEAWNRAWNAIEPALPKALHMRLPSEKIAKLASVIDAQSPAHMYATLTSHWDASNWPLRSPFHLDAQPLPLPSADLATQAMLADTLGYMPNDILTKVDRATMAVSLEAREPLLDHRLAELAWRMPVQWKIREGRGKWLLRRVLERYVPREMFERPKVGFGVPVGKWIRGELRPWAESHLSDEALRKNDLLDAKAVRTLWQQHLSGTHDHMHRLWDVLMFSEWQARARR